MDKALKETGLRTEPDFHYVWLDTPINFVLVRPSPAAGVGPGESLLEPPGAAIDPTRRLSLLKAAMTRPTCVRPEQTVSEALTVMMLHDYSQLPVMSGERDVEWAITFASIAKRLALGALCLRVRDCMERAQVLKYDIPLFDAINDIIKHQFVLVQGADKRIAGIVTTSDLSIEFKQLTEPFLLLAEIEQHVRALIERAGFTTDELREAVPDEQSKEDVSQISDLNFGAYVRLLQNEGRWRRLEVKLDRAQFVRSLDQVREIRNEVMHFDPDPLDDDDLRLLRDFLNLLQELRGLVGNTQNRQ